VHASSQGIVVDLQGALKLVHGSMGSRRRWVSTQVLFLFFLFFVVIIKVFFIILVLALQLLITPILATLLLLSKAQIIAI
jgi:hypothetical protein